MIQWSIERIKGTIDAKISTVANMEALVGRTAVGDSSESAVNSLMAMYDEASITLSRYTFARLLKTVRLSGLISLRDVLPYNPSWQGMVTELEVLTLVKSQEAIQFRNQNNTAERWPRIHSSRIGGELPLVFKDTDARLADDTHDWLVPAQFNQGCFDAIYRVSRDAIRAIDVTDADDHKCNLKFLIPYVKTMNVHVVELVYVCRRRNFDSFKVPTPEIVPPKPKKSKKAAINESDPTLATEKVTKSVKEHNQYLELMGNLTEIWRAKNSKTIPKPCSHRLQK